MKKLKIENKKKYEHILTDEQGKKHIINLEFFDIENKPQIGDYIYINEELLNPKYDGFSTSYTFGNLKNKYGRKDILKEDIDVIKIETDGLEIYLKRLYG